MFLNVFTKYIKNIAPQVSMNFIYASLIGVFIYYFWKLFIYEKIQSRSPAKIIQKNNLYLDTFAFILFLGMSIGILTHF